MVAEEDPVEAVRQQIRRIKPIDAREAVSIQQTLIELDRLVHPFDEAAQPTHATASALVVGCRGVLLHKHKRLGRWMQPGGHIDPGELPQVAVLREVVEETGLRVAHLDGARVCHVDVHEAARGHLHLDLRYLVGGSDADPAPPAGESQDVAWFPWHDALELADDALRGALRRARDRYAALRAEAIQSGR